MLIQTFETLAE